MSPAVVKRPRLKRTDSKAASWDRPMASSTSDGSIAPELQALPVDTATGGGDLNPSAGRRGPNGLRPSLVSGAGPLAGDSRLVIA